MMDTFAEYKTNVRPILNPGQRLLISNDGVQEERGNVVNIQLIGYCEASI